MEQRLNRPGDGGNTGNDWGNVNQEWKRSAANSVHSMNDDNDNYQGQTRYQGGGPGYSEYG